jgi:glycosyltransferase involved in cell wall biosynthesis
MDLKNIVCYSFNVNSQDASGQLRILGPLQQAGINLINGLEVGKPIRERVSEGDAVLIQRDFPKQFDDYQNIIDAARREGKPLIFDLDDLIFFLPENHPDRQSLYYASSLLPMFQMLLQADMVTVTTKKLKSVLAKYVDNIVILPNYFNETLWQLRSPVLKKKGEKLTIGYMGGYSHKPDLDFVMPILQDLIKRYPEKISFHFWGCEPSAEMDSLPQVEWTPHISLSYKDYSAFFQTQSADIFIAPLENSLFNSCKSGLKFFEYSALGAPGVYSNLETYSDVVSHGQNGLLATSLDEWRDCLIELIENDELRFQMAMNAQEIIREKWFLSKNAFRWKKYYQNLFKTVSRKNQSHESILQSINIQVLDAFEKREAVIKGLVAQNSANDLTVQALSAQIAEKDKAVKTLSAQIINKELTVQVLHGRLTQKEATIQSLTNQVYDKEQSVQALSQQIAEVNKSRAWRIALLLRRIRVLLAPPDSRQSRGLRRLKNGILAPFGKINRDQELRKDLDLITSSGLFDRGWYLSKNPDVEQAKVNPLIHYLYNGAFEGRDPGPNFSSTWYLSTYADVKKAGMNPLIHYLKYGRQEGRSMNALTNVSDPNSVEFIPIATEDVDPKTSGVKLIAFYLPQFHPIPENDDWWGKGFTEWTNVSKATPNFRNHYQPHLPGELGFYDLRVPEIQKRQIELARKYGIYGFCFHYYWFGGRRLLERPLNQFLENHDWDFPFCLCWANENWTRRWDGLENEILIEQTHPEDEYLTFIRDIAPIFSDNRYIRINGKPLLIVYRINLLPNPRQAVDIWRTECKKMGVGDVYLVAAQSFGITDPRPYGFDAAVEFPPHNLWSTQISRDRVEVTNLNFTGSIFDYDKAVQQMINMRAPDYTLFRTVMPAWDNTARKQNDGFSFINSTPAGYKKWLTHSIRYSKRFLPADKRFIFVNSWNEWGEGAYLEPDRLYGYAFLQATAEAIANQPKMSSISVSNWTILFVSHDANRGGAQAVLLNTISWFKEHTSIRLNVLCLGGGEWLSRFTELANTVVLEELREGAEGSSDEDVVNNLLKFCGGTIDLIYGNTVAAGREYKWLYKAGVPILTHVHELETSIKHYAGEWIDDVIKYSAHFIAGSGAVRDNLINTHVVYPENISLGYASIIPSAELAVPGEEEKNMLKKKLGLDQNKLLIFGCGLGMPFRKGADLFIELGRILQENGLNNFHLYWIGDFERTYSDHEYGNWSDHLKFLQDSKLDSFVTFLGSKENPRDYFRVGDVFVMTSREEPFGLVALEAADSGLPTICFQNAGAADFVGNDAGFVVPDENVEAMASKLISLIEDNDLRHTLGDRAREKLMDSYTVERSTPGILSICRQTAKQKPGVSVVVPNYNHEKYLPERLESIFNQTYQDFEVILLDDASTDNSREVMEKYVGRGDVRILRNEQNSGSPFKQWIKGIDLAKSEILWFAESDDRCDPEFLETLLPAFNDQKVRLAYSNSNIIDENGNSLGDYLDSPYLVSLSPTKWQSSYKVTAEQEINDGMGVKDTILNASAVLFRKFIFDNDFRSRFSEMRIAGDWYFIVNAIKEGNILYEARKLNYHRRHSESVIGKILQEKRLEEFFKEFCQVQTYIFTNYQLAPEFIEKWEEYLRQQWNEFYPSRSFGELKEFYPFDEMKKMIQNSRSRVSNHQIENVNGLDAL